VTPDRTCWTTFFRQSRLLAQLGGAGSHLAVERHEGRIFGIDGRQLLGVADDRLEVSVLLGDVNADAAVFAVQQELHAAQAALELPIGQRFRWCTASPD
jgi:hypothetical protein